MFEEEPPPASGFTKRAAADAGSQDRFCLQTSSSEARETEDGAQQTASSQPILRADRRLRPEAAGNQRAAQTAEILIPRVVTAEI